MMKGTKIFQVHLSVGMTVIQMDKITHLTTIETRNVKIMVTSIIAHSYTAVNR